MSDEECEAMIALGHDALDGRIIVDVQDRASRRDEHIRSSYSTFCEFSKTPQLAARESGVDPLPPGGQFLPHHDYFPATQARHADSTWTTQRNGGQRIGTQSGG